MLGLNEMLMEGVVDVCAWLRVSDMGNGDGLESTRLELRSTSSISRSKLVMSAACLLVERDLCLSGAVVCIWGT